MRIVERIKKFFNPNVVWFHRDQFSSGARIDILIKDTATRRSVSLHCDPRNDTGGSRIQLNLSDMITLVASLNMAIERFEGLPTTFDAGSVAA
jgi:hypothetical protein